MRFPLGQMTVGDILDRGLKLLFVRLPAFYAINLVVLSPLIAYEIVAPLLIDMAPAAGDPTAALGAVGVGLVALFITLILQPVATAAILHIVMREYVGKSASIGEACGFALTRFLSLLGTSILVGLAVAVGTLLCLIPGIYFGVAFALASQVVVLEKLSGAGAMNRSQQLVSGYWWRVFGVLLLAGLANLAVQVGVGLALESALPSRQLVPVGGGVRVVVDETNHIVNTVVTQLVNILFATYIAVCTTLVYLDLRIRKEGFDLELAAGGGGVVGGDDVGTGEPRSYQEPPKEW